MTGFPMRTAFGRGYPEHDPWRFDATRLVESGEADGALWISAYRATKPQWRSLYACQAGSRARSLLRSLVTFISVLVAAITMTSSRQVRTRL